MSSNWPGQLRTADEWRALGAQWDVADNRKAIIDVLTALKVPAMQYARAKGPERAEMVIALQEKAAPGSTQPAKAAAPAAAEAVPAAAPTGKKAAPAVKVPAGSGPVVGAGVDLTPVLAKLAEQDARLNAISAQIAEAATILKLLLLNPANADSLSLAATAEVVAEIAAKSIPDLASGNG